MESVIHHDGVVTCVATNRSGTICVSGGSDATVIVWEIDLERIHSTSRTVAPMRHLLTLTGHDDDVNFVTVNDDENLVLSGSMDGTAILFQLQNGRYLRTFPHNSPVLFGGICGRHGVIVTYSEDRKLSIYSYNGDLRFSSDVIVRIVLFHFFSSSLLLSLSLPLPRLFLPLSLSPPLSLPHTHFLSHTSLSPLSLLNRAPSERFSYPPMKSTSSWDHWRGS